MIFYFTNVTCSTPNFSGALTKDSFTSSFAAVIGCIILVAFGFAVAGGAGMVKVARYPVCPAIADRGTVY